MARQNKNDAVYFPHDADMRNDIKVKALRRNFSHTGYAVWCFLLEALTDSEDFEIEYTEISQELLAADFDVPVEKLREIVDYSVKIGLLQHEGEKIFSNAHKARFAPLLEARERRRQRAAERAEINRINGRKGGNPNFRKGQPNPYYRTTDSVMEDNPNITEFDADITEDNPIVKESKVEQSKVNNTPLIPNGDYTPPVKRLRNHQSQCSCTTATGERCRRYATWKIGETFYCNQHAKDTLGDIVENPTTKRFVPPTVDEVRAYAQEKSYNVDAEHFVDYYTSNGWRVGRNPMKDWRATVRTWASRDRAQNIAVQGTQSLGVGEFINSKGIRTYGTSGQPVPQDAPPRPSDAHYWSDNSKRWEKTL
ncbi:MAG: DUF4373 domain-containing protein [Muribaculaceae bacterium]|nr:DUF4373 domain-containing protein [Muribaculaceae bacterium]MCM1225126.1 DUF4373 domain-containing protein [Lachnospiraceae bacterium]